MWKKFQAERKSKDTFSNSYRRATLRLLSVPEIIHPIRSLEKSHAHPQRLQAVSLSDLSQAIQTVQQLEATPEETPIAIAATTATAMRTANRLQSEQSSQLLLTHCNSNPLVLFGELNTFRTPSYCQIIPQALFFSKYFCLHFSSTAFSHILLCQ